MDPVNLYDFIFSSDSSESNSDYEEPPRAKRPKIINFVTEVVDKYSDEEFKQNFRMNRRTFNYIWNEIKDDISSSAVDVGHPTIDARSQLLFALWYFATPDSYRSICSRFGIGRATGQRTVRRVTEALNKLSTAVIQWPDVARRNIIIDEFARKGFPDCIGCIDGSYIPIPQPKNHGISYICRKNFSCVILQGVCDHRMLFMHCYAGEVGSVHDATVLKRSEMWNYVSKEADMFPQNTHILGDKAYPLLPCLITPYKDNGQLTNQQKRFNYIHSKCRSVIERAFALLKNRFRILYYMDVRDHEWIVKYIIACCILHNICILQDDIFDANLEIEVNDDADVETARDIPERRRHLQAVEKRNRICRELSN